MNAPAMIAPRVVMADAHCPSAPISFQSGPGIPSMIDADERLGQHPAVLSAGPSTSASGVGRGAGRREPHGGDEICNRLLQRAVDQLRRKPVASRGGGVVHAPTFTPPP